jgi:hypothetical protein
MAARFVYARSRYLVPFDGKFRVRRAPTRPPHSQKGARANAAALADAIQAMRKFVPPPANDRALLVSPGARRRARTTIKAVMSGINPAGEVHSFKKPTEDDLDRFLRRFASVCPSAGSASSTGATTRKCLSKVHPTFQCPALPDVPRPDPWNERANRFATSRSISPATGRRSRSSQRLKDEQRRRPIASTIRKRTGNSAAR